MHFPGWDLKETCGKNEECIEKERERERSTNIKMKEYLNKNKEILKICGGCI
jgi:hypothetical protein